MDCLAASNVARPASADNDGMSARLAAPPPAWLPAGGGRCSRFSAMPRDAGRGRPAAALLRGLVRLPPSTKRGTVPRSAPAAGVAHAGAAASLPMERSTGDGYASCPERGTVPRFTPPAWLPAGGRRRSRFSAMPRDGPQRRSWVPPARTREEPRVTAHRTREKPLPTASPPQNVDAPRHPLPLCFVVVFPRHPFRAPALISSSTLQ